MGYCQDVPTHAPVACRPPPALEHALIGVGTGAEITARGPATCAPPNNLQLIFRTSEMAVEYASPMGRSLSSDTGRPALGRWYRRN